MWTEATINSVMAGHRMLHVDHAAIPGRSRPMMTMDFTLDDALDVSPLASGVLLHIEISKPDGGGDVVINIHIPGRQSQSKWTTAR